MTRANIGDTPIVLESSSTSAGSDCLIFQFLRIIPIILSLCYFLRRPIKYNRHGGRVDVTLSKTDGKTVIAVADTGIGMTEEETQKLFGEFVRIRNEKTASILGSGLGLSIIRKLALLYGGEVRVESRPDVGSTFTVALDAPVAQAPSAAATVSPGAEG